MDITDRVSDDVLEEMREAWRDHSVLFLPGQPLDVEGLERFTQRWGDWGHTEFVHPMEGHPNVLELRREPDEKASHFGQGWHSDYSFQPNPPAATLLFGHEVPPQGGDTLFADGYSAYENLSGKMKDFLEDLQGIHSAILPYSKEGFYANEGVSRSLKITASDEAKKMQAHPIIRTHPVSGQKTLFVNRVYTIGIDGLTDGEGKALLDYLCAYSTEDRFIYRHKWQRDMLTIWDNRCVQHYADAGFDGHRRVMWRTTTAGEVPE